MLCGLCDRSTHEVEIVCDETGQRIALPICDDCLLDTGNSFTLADFIQSKLDLANELASRGGPDEVR